MDSLFGGAFSFLYLMGKVKRERGGHRAKDHRLEHLYMGHKIQIHIFVFNILYVFIYFIYLLYIVLHIYILFIGFVCSLPV